MSNTTILIVEDDASIRDLYSMALEAANLKVFVAKTGQQGVDLALEHHPDVILLDIILPDITGHEALTKIRNDRWGKDAKVIFLTNMSDVENVSHAVEAGIEEYIIKVHTTPAELVNKVRTVSNS